MMDSGRVFDVLFYKRNESPYCEVVGLSVMIVEETPKEKN